MGRILGASPRAVNALSARAPIVVETGPEDPAPRVGPRASALPSPLPGQGGPGGLPGGDLSPPARLSIGIDIAPGFARIRDLMKSVASRYSWYWYPR